MYKVDIKLGYSCNNNCIHCVIQDFRDILVHKGLPEDLSTERFKYEMEDSQARGAQLVVFTGGEPTIRKDLVELLQHAKALNLKVLIQTNGRNFSDLSLARGTAQVGVVNNYCIALHAPDAARHDAITQSQGSWAETLQGITNLINLNQNVSGKIVISQKNYALIPETTQLMISLGIRYISFTFPHGCGNARRYFLEVVPRYSDIIPFVKRGLNLCLAQGIGADTETFPYCWMEGYERFATELLLSQDGPAELKQYGADRLIDWNKERQQIKSKFPQCRSCAFDLICEGPWREYPENYGDSEFKPRPGTKLTSPLQVLNTNFVVHHPGNWLATLPYSA